MNRLQNLLARGEHLGFLLAVVGTPLAHLPTIGGPDPLIEAKTLFVAWLVGVVALLRVLRILAGAGGRATGDSAGPPRQGGLTAADRRALGGSALGLLALAWGAIWTISLLHAEAPGLFFRLSLLQWAFLLWLWLASGAEEPAARLGTCLTATALSGVAVAAIGLAQYLFPQAMLQWLPYGGSAGDTRNLVFSSLGNPEYLGGYLALMLALMFCLSLRPGARAWRPLLWAAMALEIVVLLLTGARGAWLGALAGAGAAWLLERAGKRRFPRWKTAASLAAAGILTVGVFVAFSTANPLNPYRVNLWGRIMELGDPRSESIRHRVAIAAASARLIAEHPWLGVGLGRFASAFYGALEQMLAEDKTGSVASYLETLGGRTPEHAHNDALEIWVETGFPGFLLFCAIVAWGLTLMRRAGLTGDPRAWAARTALVCCIVILVESLFSFPLRLPTRGMVFWTIFGLGAAAGAEMPRAARSADSAAWESSQ
ncbi:MAG: O-antigen ligase family protein [Candidatus Sumerlaeota bacterium]|nr:O-antigen ligase family protein [Candidatus Sumerlaeota bacterium]